ncbi:type I polyketide synthase [Hyalangium versicolor]|uniref:type I polyketide synthase n=1 Tax=Hyalangium versicolor TaxID=2861190 RepID=UPI001CCB5E47|nr:type I polyketide synthase [Hyalangium versicolor]
MNEQERVERLTPLQRAFLALEQAQARIARLEQAQHEPIAVVGIGCRLPGGVHSPAEFWELLAQGRDAIGDQPGDRWDIDAFYDPDRGASGKIYVRQGGFLDSVDTFDSLFFGIAPREAIQMDPQQRLALELAWEALEDSGVRPETLRGSMTGVFLSACWNDYATLKHKAGTRIIEQHTATGEHFSIISNRISFVLGLNGPSMTVDTACSSSLTTVHLACQSLRSGESTLALAGGVNLILAPDSSVAMARLGAMAPDARCKAFDHRANGYIRGEGGGIVVLKPLAAALRDSDRIYATVRASHVNQDGASSFLTAPSGTAQRQLLRSVLAHARVKPADIDYVEAHGTGTEVGDPIEAQALGEVLSEGRPAERPCLIGSVKTNIGHLESAAGISGLIKVALSLAHQQIPASLHFEKPNPAIDLEQLKLSVPVSLTPWPQRQGPRLAGVSAFGFGGTNAHVVLEEAPAPPEAPQAIGGAERSHQIVCLSAKSEEALGQLADKWVRALERPSPVALADLAYSANTGRQHFEHRLAVVAQDTGELKARLKQYAKEGAAPDVWNGRARMNARPRIAFLFTGQGSQYPGMARQLYASSPVFRESMDRCEAILRPLLGTSLLDTTTRLDETAFTQPALFALEYSLAVLWRSWGIEPDYVLGHSLGEYAAACVAGAFSLEEGLRLVSQRGRWMQERVEPGEMAMVYGEEARVREALTPFAGRISIAAINGPESIVISGRAGQVKDVLETLNQRGLETRLLRIAYPGHSHLMDPMLGAFEQAALQVRFTPMKLGLVSNVTGDVLGPEALSAEYFCRHLRETVRFADGMRSLGRRGVEIFLEVGPKPTLVGMGPQTLSAPELSWLPSLRPDQPDWAQLLTSLAQLEVRGVPVDWSRFDRPHARRRVSVPTVAFQRRRYWLSPPAPEAPAPRLEPGAHPLLGRRMVLAGSQELRFEARLDEPTVALLAQHRLLETSLMPGAAFLDAALAAGRAALGTPRCGLRDVSYVQPLFLSGNEVPWLQIVVGPVEHQAAAFKLYGRTGSEGDQAAWVLHCEGTLVADPTPGGTPDPAFAECQKRCPAPVASEEFERWLGQRGIQPGPAFRNMHRLWRGEGEALGEVVLPQELAEDSRWAGFHPALLDACMQTLAAAATSSQPPAPAMALGLQALSLHAPIGSRVFCHTRLRPQGDAHAAVQSFDFQVFSEAGERLATLNGLQLRPVSLDTLRARLEDSSSEWLYAPGWRAARESEPQSEQTRTSGRWLLLADTRGTAQGVAKLLREQGQECIWVQRRDEYQEVSPGVFSVDPSRREHFERLLAVLRRDGSPLKGVVHLWTLDEETSPEPTLGALQDATRLGCQSTLHLVQALISAALPTPPSLWLVTRGAQGFGTEGAPVTPLHAALWGLGQSIATEHPEFRTVRVDLDPSGPDTEASFLVQELLRVESPSESALALRGGRRYVSRLSRLPKLAPGQQLPIRADATYLITGGLGGIGLETASRLVEWGARHLVLVGRGAGSDEARAQLEQLRAQGVEVLAWRADISVEEQAAAMLQQVERTMPPLHGIIHAAGVFADRLLHDHQWALFETVFAPKLAGAWNLHQLTRKLPLDFFVLYSSVASVLGLTGLGNYVAANAFLDGLARYRHQLGLPALSVSWGLWADTGMTRRVGGHRTSQLQGHGLSAMEPSRALDCLARLPAREPHVCVVDMHWEDYLRQFPAGQAPLLIEELVTKTAASPHRSRQHPPTSGIDLAGYLRTRIARTLRMAEHELDARSPLIHFGLDSLMAVELRNKIRAELGTDIPLLAFLGGSTLEELVARITTARKPPAPAAARSLRPEEARGLLANLEQLSEAEVEQLIGDLSRERKVLE